MENISAEVIVAIIGIAGGFLATILATVWRLAVLSTRIERNEHSVKLAHERIDKYSSKAESSMEEIRQQVLAIIQAQARIEEKVGFLLDAMAKITYR